ncbi:head protein [Shigella phage Shfl2]|uniref:Small outer capsid protein n=2 Tax=Tequatrovirus TaxID=10663 RepID=A0A166LV13_9CAUD|nr:head protein [Shigella phage Shfl2]YP_009290296.1 head protein [Escherichia phage vB_EcoM-UFV13]AEA72990.1 putative small outer capsid protein soc.1 [Shigella phage Shfl2]ANA50062.1 hypothetical protein vBEcoMUFV13_g031 [Escherichia phage vB_EcoM-UFV13]
MKFDFYAWQKAGRPASRAFGSDGYNIRAHWKFNAPDDYSPVVINGDVVILTKIGYFNVPREFIINNHVI